jgi:hypothetical protein
VGHVDGTTEGKCKQMSSCKTCGVESTLRGLNADKKTIKIKLKILGCKVGYNVGDFLTS